MSNSWRSAAALRTLLVASLATSVGLTAFGAASQDGGKPDPKEHGISFTSADAGSCLTWAEGDGGVSNFEQTSCDGPHRFEVSLRQDLSVYPSSEFGADAPMPGLARQAQLREELCASPTISYLEGTFDQLGKFSVASILPPDEAWKQGDRTMLCGVQATDDTGRIIETSGKAKNQDQSRLFKEGECVAVDPNGATHVVDCAEPHQLETTLVIDLREVFPDSVPSIEEQDKHLRQACTQAGRDYLGGDDELYYSTLQPFWTTLPANSWTGGSHSVNCLLMFATPEGGFATLKGSATGDFTINDAPPEELPEREPIVNPEALEELEKDGEQEEGEPEENQSEQN